MLTAYGAFAFCKEPLNLVLALIRRILATIQYDEFLEKPIYCEHGYKKQSNVYRRRRTDKLTGILVNRLPYTLALTSSV